MHRFQQLYEELEQRFHAFQVGVHVGGWITVTCIDLQESAQEQYKNDLLEKEDELIAMRERLADVENYPGTI